MVREYNLAAGFHRNALEHPERTAIVVDDRLISYGELLGALRPMAGWIGQQARGGQIRVAILASRSLEAYLGLLASAWAGAAYVPLHPGFPEPYLRRLLRAADPSALIVDAASLGLLTPGLLSDCPRAILSPLISAPDHPDSRVEGKESLSAEPAPPVPAPVSPDAPVYLMFTSGSTGEPKGIAASAANVRHFLEAAQERHGFAPEDRFSQFYDLNWDPSILSMFCAWEVGASVHVIPERHRLLPAQFIRRQELSVWCAVPAQIEMMARAGMLKAGHFPSLRRSFFAGQPLTRQAAEQWQQAAPNSTVENLYGPTEATVVCTGQLFDGTEACLTPERGYVAIGTPYRGTHLAILDAGGRFLDAGEHGELAIAGPQVTPGYWRDPGLTRERFRTLRHPALGEAIWYLTGDQAYEDRAGRFHFLGRIDNQVKMRGARVELEEVEFHLRRAARQDDVCVVAWPVVDGVAGGLAAFIGGACPDTQALAAALRESLPAFMVPRTIRCLPTLPRTGSGKVDRKQLLRSLEGQMGP